MAVEKVEGEKQVETGKWGGEERTVVNQIAKNYPICESVVAENGAQFFLSIPYFRE